MKSELKPAKKYRFEVWSPGDRTISLTFHRVDGVRGIKLTPQGSSGGWVELRLFPTGKKGEVFAEVKPGDVFFYDFGRVFGSPVVPDRRPIITRGGKILKAGHIYRIHCEKENIDKFIRFQNWEY